MKNHEKEVKFQQSYANYLRILGFIATKTFRLFIYDKNRDIKIRYIA